MLKNLKIENFRSVGDPQELCLEIQNKDILDDSSRKVTQNLNLNLVTTLVGHNASGKTNILNALTFIFWFVNDSYTKMKGDRKIPIEPHKLRQNDPIQIEIEFLDQKTLYKYSIALSETQVISEYLGEHRERGFTRIFEYVRKGKKGNQWNFKSNSNLKINEKDKDRFRTRKNVSVLSSLIDTGYLDQISFFKNADSNVSYYGYDSDSLISKFFDISEYMYENEALRKKILSFISNLDIGISDFTFSDAILRSSDKSDENVKRKILKCVHRSKKNKFTLDLIEESDGTIQGLDILSNLIPILDNGGIALIDEIEHSLHPYVLKKIISLFEKKESNPKNAQLIFATHQHLLLNDRTKSQIYLAEKNNETFETEIYRLDEVEGVRNDENYFQKYLAGVYGGVPRIDWF